MVAPVTVSEKDLRTLLGIVSDHRADLPAEGGLPLSLLADLMGQIRCDAVSFEGLDSNLRTEWFWQGIPDWDDDDANAEALDQAHWEHYWDCQPCSYADRSGDLRRITKISDFYSGRQWHSIGMYSDFFRLLGLEHQLILALPEAPGRTAKPGRTVRLVFNRGPGPDFSERDRALLALLRPHLHQAYLDAERRRRPVPQLTTRHWELLRLVAAGLTNAQIARRLDVTEKTVGKHLENIYTRLQVFGRTAAVTRAFPDGAAQTATVPGGSAS
jgi:DNA-binding CsgD family transcriptional regulator